MSDTIDRPLDNDPLAEEFFSQPPPPTETPSEHWEARPMSADQRRAMRATLAMLLGLAVVTACFAAYAEIAMVKPAPLGNAGLPRVAAAEVAQQPSEPLTARSADAERQLPVADQQPATEALPPGDQHPQAAAQPPAELEAAPPAPLPSAAIADGSALPQPSSPLIAAQGAAPTPSAAPAARHGASEMQVKRGSERGTPSSENAPAVDALTKRAYGELRHGRAQEAIELASHAIRLDPARASAYIALGGARDAIGDHLGALAVFRECVRRANDKLTDACRTLAR